MVLVYCFAILGAITIIVSIIEKIERDTFRLVHILIIIVILLVIIECIIKHIYWNEMSTYGFVNSSISKSLCEYRIIK